MDMHRAILSLREELDAVDWYAQRAEATTDDTLRAVLTHNQNEEVEHAMMILEWIRRRSPVFDECARKYLFTAGSVATERAERLDDGLPGRLPFLTNLASAATPGAHPPSTPTDGSLGIGSLKP